MAKREEFGIVLDYILQYITKPEIFMRKAITLAYKPVTETAAHHNNYHNPLPVNYKWASDLLL